MAEAVPASLLDHVACLLSTEGEPIVCDGGCGLSKCPKNAGPGSLIEFASLNGAGRFDARSRRAA